MNRTYNVILGLSVCRSVCQTVWAAHWKRCNHNALWNSDLQLGHACVPEYVHYAFSPSFVPSQCVYPPCRASTWPSRTGRCVWSAMRVKPRAWSWRRTQGGVDEIQSIKRAWELVQPGRSAKVTWSLKWRFTVTPWHLYDPFPIYWISCRNVKSKVWKNVF